MNDYANLMNVVEDFETLNLSDFARKNDPSEWTWLDQLALIMREPSDHLARQREAVFDLTVSDFEAAIARSDALKRAPRAGWHEPPAEQWLRVTQALLQAGGGPKSSGQSEV